MFDRVHNFIDRDQYPFPKNVEQIESASVQELRQRIKELEVTKQDHFKL